MLRPYIAALLLVLLLQPGCSSLRPGTRAIKPVEAQVFVEVAVCYGEHRNAIFAHFCIKNESTHRLMLNRWEEWADQPPLVLNCYQATGAPGYPAPRTERGLSRWPEPPLPGDRDIRHHQWYTDLLIGSHVNYAEIIPPGGFVTFRVQLSDYFRLTYGERYVLGGMVQVLAQVALLAPAEATEEALLLKPQLLPLTGVNSSAA